MSAARSTHRDAEVVARLDQGGDSLEGFIRLALREWGGHHHAQWGGDQGGHPGLAELTRLEPCSLTLHNARTKIQLRILLNARETVQGEIKCVHGWLGRRKRGQYQRTLG